MKTNIKNLLLGLIAGASSMLAFLCLLGWQYEINHPVSEEVIVVDSVPSDTAIHLGTIEGNAIRK